jgi:hypothetical protein
MKIKIITGYVTWYVRKGWYEEQKKRVYRVGNFSSILSQLKFRMKTFL